MGDVRVRAGSGWVSADGSDVPRLIDGRRPSTVWVHVDGGADVLDAARDAGAPPAALELAQCLLPSHRGAHGHLDDLPDGGLALTVPTVSYAAATRDVRTGTVTCLLVGSLVVTGEDGDAGVVEHAWDRLDGPRPVPGHGARQVLVAVLQAVVTQAGDVERDLGDAVADAEQLMFSADGRPATGRLYQLKREIAEARHALGPLTAVLPELTASQEDDAERTETSLGRLETTVDRIDRRLAAHDGLLGDMLQVHLAEVSVRQNEDMRKISAWAAMVAAPTLVAGVYGMNFQHMPELGWAYGYASALGLMVATCAVLYRSFKRSGWL